MVRFVGAGPGAADLITVRGQRAIAEADMIIHAGSLVNPALLAGRKPDCVVLDSSGMTLEEMIERMRAAHAGGMDVVRLHTGDPSLYGAIREQMDGLERYGIACEVVPGVSSFLGAAASLKAELTLPGLSQTVILTRLEGRTSVPEAEDVRKLAAHRATMVIFLSASRLDELAARLTAGGYAPDAPAAIVCRASWEDERIVRTTIADLAEAAEKHGITRTALVFVGPFLEEARTRSKLYDPAFSHGFREGTCA
jgi:precorrin-4/cobalt-precorrin-4 C11-methyltransferase